MKSEAARVSWFRGWSDGWNLYLAVTEGRLMAVCWGSAEHSFSRHLKCRFLKFILKFTLQDRPVPSCQEGDIRLTLESRTRRIS